MPARMLAPERPVHPNDGTVADLPTTGDRLALRVLERRPQPPTRGGATKMSRAKRLPRVTLPMKTAGTWAP